MRVETFSKSLDELHTDLLVTTLFENERPPRGVTGLIDWRLNSFLSRRIVDGTIRGRFDERILIPLQGRLPARRWLLIGLGKLREFTLSRAQSLGVKLGVTLAHLTVTDAALWVPKAVDAKLNGETERAVIEALRQSDPPAQLYLQWLDSSVARPFEFPALKTVGILVQHHAA